MADNTATNPTTQSPPNDPATEPPHRISLCIKIKKPISDLVNLLTSTSPPTLSPTERYHIETQIRSLWEPKLHKMIDDFHLNIRCHICGSAPEKHIRSAAAEVEYQKLWRQVHAEAMEDVSQLTCNYYSREFLALERMCLEECRGDTCEGLAVRLGRLPEDDVYTSRGPSEELTFVNQGA